MIDGGKIISKPIRWAMVGGGKGSQIGYIHRSSALRDRNFDLVAGAFDINPERGKEFGVDLGVSEERCYPDYKTMFSEEAKRKNGIQAVSIATPNGTHYEISKAALKAGLHVVCEKPLCFENSEAEELVALSEKKGLVLGVTYGYSGHQLIHQAREMIENGDLGDIRFIKMEFAHGAYNTAIEANNPSAKWRMDPKYAGPSFVLGDVGTHTLFLAETMVPDLQIDELLCSSQSFVEGRQLEDNANVLIKFKNGVNGTLWASAINCGSMHGQIVRVVGSKASVQWWDERPNQITYEIEGKPVQILERGGGYLYPEALSDDRIGGGHPEGLFESWSNLYRKFAIAIDAAIAGNTDKLGKLWYPNVKDGAQGVKFVNACVESARKGETWVKY